MEPYYRVEIFNYGEIIPFGVFRYVKKIEDMKEEEGNGCILYHDDVKITISDYAWYDIDEEH
jgi:hypothetical protein